MSLTIEDLIKELNKFEQSATDDEAYDQKEAAKYQSVGDQRGELMFRMHWDNVQKTHILSLLIHNFALTLVKTGTPPKELERVIDQLQQVLARQNEMDEFYKNHKKGLRWAENLQKHTPETERGWKFWRK